MLKIAVVVVVLIAILAVARGAGVLAWRAAADDLRARLLVESARGPAAALPDVGEFDSLPPPVARYLRAVLRDRQPMPSVVRLRHTGTFNTSETGERWSRFTSDQLVTFAPPGFDWDGRIRMLPGIPVHVHDAYVTGEGILQAALVGLIPVARLRDRDQVARGELMRWLAETPWYPLALAPGRGVSWTPVDAHSAIARLTDGSLTVELTFDFGADGLIEGVRTEARARKVGDSFLPTPWQGRFWDYRATALGVVPFRGEVAWLLPEGRLPYWRGELEEIGAP